MCQVECSAICVQKIFFLMYTIYFSVYSKLAYIEAADSKFPKFPQKSTQLSNNLLLFKWSFQYNHERIFIQFSIKKGRKKRIKSKRV